MDENPQLPEWIWCIVGNVIDEHPYGEDRMIVHGTKQFSPGAKVYCLPVQWGDGYERIPVIGKPRKKRGLIRAIMRREYIENFRCKKVYSREVIQHMYRKDRFRVWGNTDEDYQTIQRMLRWLNYSEEESKRDWQIHISDEILLTSQVQERPETKVVLRIEHRRRKDGYAGSAWYGFYSFGESEEKPIGIIDWYSHWPEAEPDYDWHKGHYDKDFIYGLLESASNHGKIDTRRHRTTAAPSTRGTSRFRAEATKSKSTATTAVPMGYHSFTVSLKHGVFQKFGVMQTTPLICPSSCQEEISGKIRPASGSYSQGWPHRIHLRQNV